MGSQRHHLANGSILTRADLPQVPQRWVASRKAVVAMQCLYGLLPLTEVLGDYSLSERFDLWSDAVSRHGVAGLKVTSIQKNKQL
ncbi:MAG: DUF1153 domain-containing protein [Paracoccaceae bacterium]